MGDATKKHMLHSDGDIHIGDLSQGDGTLQGVKGQSNGCGELGGCVANGVAASASPTLCWLGWCPLDAPF
eukprot:2040276-Prorocentrum_lima.AAC.1